ncbi:transposase [Moritella sp. PE36]|uniref:transposase n=1 Tax=Moritella sp. PE36 TaxID=58051 RepID=UPI001E3C6CDA|nr:transposase [Moritella sp. PE36]
MPNKWVVDYRKVGYGLPALQYLSRYLYRSLLPDKDIMNTSDNRVTFKYKDSQTQVTKTRTLPILQQAIKTKCKRICPRCQHEMTCIGTT